MGLAFRIQHHSQSCDMVWLHSGVFAECVVLQELKMEGVHRLASDKLFL